MDNFNFDTTLPPDIDIVMLKRCLKAVFQNQICDMDIQNQINTKFYIKSIVDSEETKTIDRLLGVHLSLLNSLANPVLYAFWYPVFRTYVWQILDLCKIKSERAIPES
eukprot:GFUD01128454.1.p1 GENE.GFUD01128454.1~~GFUD01128454.1.p1  ORF type:complete len:108 (+),score=9.36 GFUD01128454.1:239-562(+)